MKTLMTIKQQEKWISENWKNATLKHKWSTRGMGSSKIVDTNNSVVGKAGGCGYDRFGAALGNAISALFPDEIYKLARRECKGRRRTYKKSKRLYGLFYNSVKKNAWLDGGCGHDCMRRILNVIGFSLVYVGETDGASSGTVFYSLKPITKTDRGYLQRNN